MVSEYDQEMPYHTLKIKKVRKNSKIWNRYNQVQHPTRDAIWESDKSRRKHHIQESQEVSPFPAGDHKAARNRHGEEESQNTNKKTIHSQTQNKVQRLAACGHVLKIKRNDWLHADTCPQAANHCALF